MSERADRLTLIPVALISWGLEVSAFEVSVLLVSDLLLSGLDFSSVLVCELSVLDLLSELSTLLALEISSLLSELVTSLTTLDSVSEISDSADSAAELSCELSTVPEPDGADAALLFPDCAQPDKATVDNNNAAKIIAVLLFIAVDPFIFYLFEKSPFSLDFTPNLHEHCVFVRGIFCLYGGNHICKGIFYIVSVYPSYIITPFPTIYNINFYKIQKQPPFLYDRAAVCIITASGIHQVRWQVFFCVQNP